jgi:Protein of unknown function (DUF2516)
MWALDQVETWFARLLFWGLVALRSWAVVDCALRKAAAFPAAEKQTKVIWLAGTIATALLGPFLPFPFDIISVIVALVYLADVRPAVREVSGGNRW